MSVCAFTGHRPGKLPYLRRPHSREYGRLCSALECACLRLAQEGVTEFLSGMALGVDMLAAEIVLRLRKGNPGLSLTCVLPFREQAARWNEFDRNRHGAILMQADKIVCLSESYSRYTLLARDRYLVNRCDCLVAVFNGSKGGTWYTVECARAAGRRILRIDPETFAIREAGEQLRLPL